MSAGCGLFHHPESFLEGWEVVVRIGEAAAAANMSTKALRFYEEQGLIPRPDRASNGYRQYADETVNRLKFIRRGRAAGLNLNQIRDILRLRDAGQAPCRHVSGLLEKELDELDAQIAGLIALRATVASLSQTAAAASPLDCEPDRICSYI